MDILREKTVKARKPHSCDWCNSEIKVGQEYKKTVCKGDYIYDWKECNKCKKYVEEMYEELEPQDDGYSSDDFEEFIYEKYEKTISELLEEMEK
jgi:hypothetical protein